MKTSNLKAILLATLTLVSTFVNVPTSYAENWTDRINKTNDAAGWAKESAKRSLGLDASIREQIPAACTKVSFRGIACDIVDRDSDGFISGLVNTWCEGAEAKIKKCEAESNKLLDSLESLPACENYPDGAFQDFEKSDGCVKDRAYVIAEWVARMTVGFQTKCNIIPVANEMMVRYPMMDYQSNEALVNVTHTGTGYYRHPIDWNKCVE